MGILVAIRHSTPLGEEGVGAGIQPSSQRFNHSGLYSETGIQAPEPGALWSLLAGELIDVLRSECVLATNREGTQYLILCRLQHLLVLINSGKQSCEYRVFLPLVVCISQ